MSKYENAMRRALQHALRGPAFGVNPQVGAVILDENNSIVAKGWHEGAGTAHAEVMAIQDAAGQLYKGKFAPGYTAVVTLEPCNHTGKTGPCAQALIEAGISRVVYAVSDPGVESANGAATLRAAGIEVVSGVLAEEAEDQMRVWLQAARQGHPFVTLKWASSLDGRSAANDGSSKWISGEESRNDSHLRRSSVDAILVGTATAIADDAVLTARKPDGSLYAHQPLRVVLGTRELPQTLRVFNDDAETIQLKTRDLHEALTALKARGIKHLWVEGGAVVATEFIRQGLVNEYLVYLAPLLLGGERNAVGDIGVTGMPGAKQLVFKEVINLGADILIRAEESK